MDLVDVTPQVPSPLGLDDGRLLLIHRAELTDDLTRPDICLGDRPSRWPDVVVPLFARKRHWEWQNLLLDGLAVFFRTATHGVVVLVLEVTGRISGIAA